MTEDDTIITEYMRNHDTLAITIIEPVKARHFDAVRVLFKEYLDLLYSLPNMHLHHDMQSTDTELSELETGKYSAPDGAILLALQGDEFVGTVAVRKLVDGICEMKRLYVNPKHRGSSVGVQLAKRIIQKSRDLGYYKMRLDTHPSMTKAHQLYYSLGFYDIPKYNENRVPGALFMEIEL
jgi:ribosomal protein S18 acetylase RimI-like enzyme